VEIRSSSWERYFVLAKPTVMSDHSPSISTGRMTPPKRALFRVQGDSGVERNVKRSTAPTGDAEQLPRTLGPEHSTSR
jgi:hypothetical protein